MLRKLFGKEKSKNTAPQTVPLRPVNYPAMVIVAWAKAIDGDENLQTWLKENGYPELFAAVYAIYLKDEPREWLLKNGYAHLMAMINTCEGNKSSGKWLLANGFELLYHVGKAVDHERDSWDWLADNASVDIILLAKSIQKIKDTIEENHNDMHSIGKDL